MHLTRVSISGFKSFARPTELRFGRELTAIVGPNGSGKSNVLDAVRWCLGEQSMKAIRGKKSTDVLFAGATGRGRGNVAEVELVLDNSDHAVPIEFDEVTITRRLHRDGEAEYLLNGRPARLADITLLLAQANFGQKSYSIVGQGMVDHVVSATPAERLQFFIEATGVRQFQLRRDEAVGKLNLTSANLQEAGSRLAELSPVLHSLTRQVKRLERRDQLAAELSQWQGTYYWHRSQASNDEKVLLYRRLHDAEAKQQAARQAVATARQEAKDQADGQRRTDLFAQLQAAHAEALAQRDELMRQATLTAAEAALDEAVAEATPSRAAASLPKVIATLRSLEERLGQPSPDVASVRSAITDAVTDLEEIHRRNEGLPAAAVKKVQESFKKAVGVAGGKKSDDPRLAAAEALVAKTSEALTKAHEQAQGNEQQRAAAQAALQAATEALGREDAAVAAIQVEVARWQAQAEDLAAELERELRRRPEQLSNELGIGPREQGGPEAWLDKIQKLKEQVAQAGGIDPEVVDEYRQVKQRCDFLTEQTEDLQKAMDELRKVVRELDKTIEKQFHANFEKIAHQFSHYFKTLFGGGRASLEMVTLQHDDPTDDGDVPAVETTHASSLPSGAAAADSPLDNVGIQVDACPPGKKVNAVQALSGGERTLLSTALLCAIIACNPSPFVIMDEVDAALDEANAERLATIFHELNQKTQIIVITHNRVIMQHADALYGVTMGPEGDSRVLSVSLKDAAAAAG